jgi:hypothetical protein
MSDENIIERHTTRVIVTHDGKVMIEQPGGDLQEARSRTDWDRVTASGAEASSGDAVGCRRARLVQGPEVRDGRPG